MLGLEVLDLKEYLELRVHRTSLLRSPRRFFFDQAQEFVRSLQLFEP
jgi:hypothetical protein